MTGEDIGGDASTVEEAVELLRTFEFTEYEAKCFVALSRISQGTAKDVSEVADVPRARVYDSMDALEDRGLVDVQQTSPQRYRAASIDETIGVLERQYTRRLERLETCLSRLEPPGESSTEGDVWLMTGDDEVSERIQHLLGGAETEVLLAVAVEDLLDDDVLDALSEATDRGVEITAGSPSESIRARLRESVPGADVLETWTWWESHPIQSGAISSVVMVDGRGLLVSADAESELPGVRKHRALWTDSRETPLVGMMRPLLENAITQGGWAAP